jgi:hypothetical protein
VESPHRNNISWGWITGSLRIRKCGMAERRLTILAYINKTPSFAMCDKCHLKFFTPKELTKKPAEADANLRQKFEIHECRCPASVGNGGSVRPLR